MPGEQDVTAAAAAGEGGAYADEEASAEMQGGYDTPGGGEFFEDYEPVSALPAEPGRATPEDYSAALEELGAEQPRRRGIVVLVALVVILLVIAIAGGVIYMYKKFGTPQQGGEVPVIAPPAKPIKTAPPAKSETGTMPVRRKQIYDRILTDGEEEKPARIKPSEEKPMTPPAPAAPPATGEGAEPLPLPLPPPPSLDGGSSGMTLTPSENGEEKRVTAEVPASPSVSEQGASEVSPAGAGQRAVAREVATMQTKEGASPLPRDANALPLPPVPPVPGMTESESGASSRLDEKGLAALAARAGHVDAQAETPPPKTQARRLADTVATSGGTTATQKRAVAAVSGVGRTTANTARTKAATASKNARAVAKTAGKVSSRTVSRVKRQTRSEVRKKRAASTKRLPAAARVDDRGNAAAAGRGPRSILPSAVAGSPAAVRFASRESAPRAIVPLPGTPATARNVAAEPGRKVKITNFNAGRAQPAAPARNRVPAVATAPRRVASVSLATQTGTRALQGRRSTSNRGVFPTPQTRQAGNAAGRGGYVVQLAAYRSQEDALRAYQRIRARHGGLLGGLSPVIQKKDLGAAGVFYRLAVGPLASRDQARRLCNALIARGEKDCLVRRR